MLTLSKITVDKRHGGPKLLKAIDYFCQFARAPEFVSKMESTDQPFAKSDFFQRIGWVQEVTDLVYQPEYTDMLNVAFTSMFQRGKLQDLVELFRVELGNEAIRKGYSREILRITQTACHGLNQRKQLQKIHNSNTIGRLRV
ncbi:MAG: hypothetical protein QXG05_05670 [Nitrososphaerota archaeon]